MQTFMHEIEHLQVASKQETLFFIDPRILVQKNSSTHLTAQCKGVDIKLPPFWSTKAPLDKKYLRKIKEANDATT